MHPRPIIGRENDSSKEMAIKEVRQYRGNFQQCQRHKTGIYNVRQKEEKWVKIYDCSFINIIIIT